MIITFALVTCRELYFIFSLRKEIIEDKKIHLVEVLGIIHFAKISHRNYVFIKIISLKVLSIIINNDN